MVQFIMGINSAQEIKWWVIEDTDTTLNDIKMRFSDYMTELNDGLTYVNEIYYIDIDYMKG